MLASCASEMASGRAARGRLLSITRKASLSSQDKSSQVKSDSFQRLKLDSTLHSLLKATPQERTDRFTLPPHCMLSSLSLSLSHAGTPLPCHSSLRSLYAPFHPSPAWAAHNPLVRFERPCSLSQLNLHVNLKQRLSKLPAVIDCCPPNSLQGTRQLLASRVHVSSPGPTSSLPSRRARPVEPY